MQNTDHLLKRTPVAVIGMSSIFAQSRNLEEYWKNIVEGKDCITDVPSSRWNIEDHYDPDPTAPDKSFCKRGGFIPDIDFNPMEFGLPPNMLEVTDVAQLLALLAARDAFRDAGYGDDARFTQAVRERTGVILGVGGGQKLITPLTTRLQVPVLKRVLKSSGLSDEDVHNITEKFKKAYIEWNENSFPGMLGNVISGRITNRFDLGGINCVVDAACAASLSAIKMAVSELIEGRCDMMLTGGVDADNSPFMFLSFSKTPAFSHKGHSCPFDAEADGMLIGEGIGMLVCKRLEDAERDGDRIYAVIKGIGSSSDGRSSGIYAPRASGQALAIRRTYEEADYLPSTVGLIEAHGTGTIVGDPTEFESMRSVFGENGAAGQHIALGSIKSQIGHTKTSAGVAGMIKVCLALHQKVLPGTINVRRPNPKFNIESSPFYINTETRPWIKAKEAPPRRASLSAFGFGGVNVHITMEEYNSDLDQKFRLYSQNEMVIVHAPTPGKLWETCEAAIQRLQSSEGEKHYRDLIEESRQTVIPDGSARLGFVCTSSKDAIGLLGAGKEALKARQGQDSCQPLLEGIFYQQTGTSFKDRVVVLFPGQGSQYVNMGKDLASSFPPVRKAFEEADSLFIEEGLEPLSKWIFPIPVFSQEEKRTQEKALTRTENAQPAIGVLSAGLYRLLQQAGLKPDFVAGHSFGELTALWAAGVYDDKDFFNLAKSRGRAMMPPKDKPGFDAGGMLAVKGDAAQIQLEVEKLSDVRVANINSGSQVVLGGETEAIKLAQSVLQEKGYSTVLLPVSAAFHTELVKHAQEPFAEVIKKTAFKKPGIRIYSNTTARPYPDEVKGIKAVLQDHILKSVLFKDQIENIYNDGGRIFIEAGPNGILTKLVKDILKDRPHLAMALNPNPQKNPDYQIRQAIVSLRVAGLDLRGFDPYQKDMEKIAISSKNRMMNVTLNGSNYVSQKTRTAFEDSLNDGYCVQKVKKVMKTEYVRGPEPTTAPNLTEILDNLTLGQIADYLRNKIMGSLAESDIERQKRTESTVPIAAEPAAARVPQEQMVASRAPVTASAVSADELSRGLLEIVSEKTGYPVEMIELEMNMEADLGIDSIKRVEIFGAMQERHAEITGVDPQEMSELQTLAQVAGYIQGKAGVGSPAVMIREESTSTAAEPVAGALMELKPSATGLSADELSRGLLEIVSEKTGYPVEMIELEMNMEADLGIDSIKRVEIFGAMQERHAEITGVDPQEMSELQTLAQVAGYIQGKAGVGSPAENITVPGDPTEKIQAINRSTIRLKYLPLPDYLENTFSGDYTTLLTNDGTALTTEVSELLLKEGGKVVVLSLPEHLVAKKNSLSKDLKEIVLKNTSDECIQSTINGIENIRSFIHLHPHFEVGGGDFGLFFEKEKEIIKTVFLIAKYLKQPLDSGAKSGRSSFMVVTHMDGELGVGGRVQASPLCGGLFGLTKTLNLEWPFVFCRAVDLGPDLESSAQHIIAEMHDPDSGLMEVGYSRHNGRQTLVAEKANVDRGGLQNPEIGPSTVFIVSGGGKGVTAECAIRLAENYKCRFILLGRSSNRGSEPDWAKGCHDEKDLKRLIMQDLQSGGQKPAISEIQKIYNGIIANREINKTLQAIKQAGGEAVYIAVDVTDVSSLKKALPKAIEQMGRITGIIHGAGRLADKLIEDKTEADFEAVYSVKVEGLRALLSCVPIDDLRHLVLFSSVAGLYGNVGQSDYAIANETLNKTAHFLEKHHPLCHVSAINWGPWDSGMVSPELKKHFEKHHIALIPTNGGASMFVDEMSPTYRDEVQAVIGNALPFVTSRIDNKLRTYRILRKLTLEANPFLNDHTVGEHPVVPVVCVVGWFSHACENIYPDFKVFSCEDNKLFKGIVFDGSHAEKYILDLTEIKKNTDEIVFEGLIWSNGSNGRKKKNFHYGSIIKLVKDIPDAPVFQNGDKRVGSAHEIAIEELYHNGTLFHGPVFQGIKKILSLTPERIVLECQLPRISEKVLGQFPTQTVNTILMDMQYQAMLVWVKHFQNAKSLPLKTRRAKFYGTIPFDKKFFITVDVRSSNEFKMVADIATYDEDYRLYIQTQGAEVTLMQKGQVKNQGTEDSVDKRLAVSC